LIKTAAFHFPLCLLAQGESISERLNNIMEFAIVNEAIKIPDEVWEKGYCEEDFPEVKEWDPGNLIHQKMLITAKRKRKIISDCFSVFSNYEAVSEYIDEFEIQFGNDMWTRIGVDITWDTLKGDFDYESFAILCAINGILGAKDVYKRITLERIRAAMNGYKKYSIYKEISQSGNLPNNNISEITDRTLYRRLDKLSEMNFFRKYTYKNRLTYYSTRIGSNKKLAETVCKLKSKRTRDREIIYSIEQTYGLRE